MSRFPVARASIQAVISKPCMGAHVRAFSTRTSSVPRRTVSGSDIDTPYRFCIEWIGVGLVSSPHYPDRSARRQASVWKQVVIRAVRRGILRVPVEAPDRDDEDPSLRSG